VARARAPAGLRDGAQAGADLALTGSSTVWSGGTGGWAGRRGAVDDLALEEHRYHAEHTSAGVSLDQPRETSRRLAADSVTAPTDTNHQLVAEDSSGKVVGSIVGTIYQLADDQIQRYLLPPRYGYVGLTVVTEAARGTGVGRPLIDATMGWFAGRGVQTAFLHYIPDNPLSSRFWPRAGFQPHIEIYSSR
jgi:GNAT superfamily N-acetyltransferase